MNVRQVVAGLPSTTAETRPALSRSPVLSYTWAPATDTRSDGPGALTPPTGPTTIVPGLSGLPKSTAT